MKINPFILSETNWLDIRDRDFDVAVLPWGATEPHNYHLPYVTDTMQVNYIAEKSGELAWNNGSKVIVLPAVPWGSNAGQIDLKLCLHINPSTQMILLNDIVENLKRFGINKLVIINGHGGNDFIPAIREMSVKHPGIFICFIDWWKVLDATKYFTDPGDHAGEMETSLMMAISPELVLPLEKAGDGSSKRFSIEGLDQRWVWAQRKWTVITESTGVGSPYEATRKKGEVFLMDVIEKIGKFLTDLAGTKMEDMYK